MRRTPVKKAYPRPRSPKGTRAGARPRNLLYSDDHLWLRSRGGRARIGITHVAQDTLSDIAYISFEDVGTDLVRGQVFAELESIKAAVELSTPVAGILASTNRSLEENPQAVNEDAYGAGWMVEVKLTNLRDLDALMSAPQYDALAARELDESQAHRPPAIGE